MNDILQDFPKEKKYLIDKAFNQNQDLVTLRMKIMKKKPIYGVKKEQTKALAKLKELTELLNFKKAKYEEGTL